MVKLKPSKEVIIEITRKIYTDAIRPLKTSPRDQEGFIKRWETVLEKVLEVKAPKANYTVQIYNLIKTLKNILDLKIKI